MKIFTLIEKDIRLAGKNFWMSMLVLLALPVFLNQQNGIQYSVVYVLIMTLNFSMFFLFNNIFLMEDKYKGWIYMLALPFGKKRVVLAKYILAFLIFALSVICYKGMEKMGIYLNLSFAQLNYQDISIVFLEFSLIVGLFFPLYYKFSYTKIKIFLAAIMIFIPTWGLVMLKYVLGIEVVTRKLAISDGALIGSNVFSMIIMICSVFISIKFLHSKK